MRSQHEENPLPAAFGGWFCHPPSRSKAHRPNLIPDARFFARHLVLHPRHDNALYKITLAKEINNHTRQKRKAGSRKHTGVVILK
ncbi:hypothetical protein SDC9_198706 [bioreactor metagenome]|uniref:Uncharacterized protein n=1 Tax=bioreactor metagenome TaxID=1076179 RepID=A0A645IIE8_9ZZZZ